MSGINDVRCHERLGVDTPKCTTPDANGYAKSLPRTLLLVPPNYLLIGKLNLSYMAKVAHITSEILLKHTSASTTTKYHDAPSLILSSSLKLVPLRSDPIAFCHSPFFLT